MLGLMSPGSRLLSEGSRVLGQDRFERDLRLSIVLHDFGKTFYNFRYPDPMYDLSFAGHEVISAWASATILRATDLPEEDMAIVFASVLLHHHAMSLESRLEYLCRRFGDDRVTAEMYDAFLREVGDLVPGLLPDVARIEVDGVQLETDIHGLIQEVNYMYRQAYDIVWAGRRPEIVRAFMLTLSGLVSLDNAAAAARGGGFRFGDVSSAFARIYLGSERFNCGGAHTDFRAHSSDQPGI
ncbi:MAG: hypothetical protein ACP5ME_12745 [Anaerolineae bacterium]